MTLLVLVFLGCSPLVASKKEVSMTKLNIGSGVVRKPGYVSIDKYESKADVKAAAHELSMYANGSIEEVLSSHMVEHLPPDEFELALREWHRVLKPGGKLVIRCPNFEVYVKEFIERDDDYRYGKDGSGSKAWGLINIFGHQTGGAGYLTRSGFSVERFQRVLPQFGFRITRCEVMQTREKRGVGYRSNGDIICEAVKI
jgi:ubiquinone/menaquinone biosynthesis C-methylase UbiE